MLPSSLFSGLEDQDSISIAHLGSRDDGVTNEQPCVKHQLYVYGEEGVGGRNIQVA